MDRSAVEAIVRREIEPLKERLGLAHWHTAVDLGPIEDGAIGQCSRKIDYDKAYIELDPGRLDDEEEILKVLRHELFHVIVSPFDLFERGVANAGLSGAMNAVLGRVWDHAVEQAVINLERMFAGLTRPEKSTDG
jgi:hypothetical protein